tara:strand:+ start:3105 stop:3272 length:168 start_codon:yes stop_codon:yes gene_type:complete
MEYQGNKPNLDYTFYKRVSEESKKGRGKLSSPVRKILYKSINNHKPEFFKLKHKN